MLVQIEFEPVSLQTQTPFNVQKKLNSKFQELETARIVKKTTKFGPKNITQIKQT